VSETEERLFAVIPSGWPSGVVNVRTVTPVAKWPNSWRN
jgi:hypothetical protein